LSNAVGGSMAMCACACCYLEIRVKKKSWRGILGFQNPRIFVLFKSDFL
jgi:hypothetical protein